MINANKAGSNAEKNLFHIYSKKAQQGMPKTLCNVCTLTDVDGICLALASVKSAFIARSIRYIHEKVSSPRALSDPSIPFSCAQS